MKERPSQFSPESSTQKVLEGILRAKLHYLSRRMIKNPEGNSGFYIRTPQENDAFELKALYLASFPGYPFSSMVHTEEGHQKFLKDPSSIRIIAESELGEICASAALGSVPPDLSGEIKQVVVHPRWREKGLSLSLIQSLVEIGEIAGLQYLYMDVRARMIQMQKTALRAGFSAVGFRVGQHLVYHPAGPKREHMIHMVKLLNGAGGWLDEGENQKIEPRIICQLQEAGVRVSLP